MTFDYAKTATTALRLLTKFGRDVVRRNYSVGVYDPATGANAVTYADTTWKGALLDFGAGKTLERGSLIQVGDKRLLLEAGATPQLEDHMIVGTVEYAIISVGEVNPAGTSVLFDLHLRGV